MSYAGCIRTAAMVPNLTNNASSIAEIATGVVPASAHYVLWLSSGCSLIEGALTAAGYSAPVPATAAAYDFVADLEATYGAARAEMARASPRSAMGERGRGETLMRQFQDGLKMLMAMDLTRMGVTQTGKLYAGGISLSDKDTVASDTDRVTPRFERGMFDGDLAETSAS
mgnify:CR=1 FL=1